MIFRRSDIILCLDVIQCFGDYHVEKLDKHVACGTEQAFDESTQYQLALTHQVSLAATARFQITTLRHLRVGNRTTTLPRCRPFVCTSDCVQHVVRRPGTILQIVLSWRHER